MALAAALAATVVLSSGSSISPAAATTAAPDCPSPQKPTPLAVSSRAAPGARPVVLVHGWNSSGSEMASTVAPKLAESLGAGFRLYAFDYGKDADAWAAAPAVGGCLAAFIRQVADAYSKAVGDDKVLVVGHSMGGLAARFAVGPSYPQYGAGVHLGGLITMDTPHLGSMWGGTDFARIVAQIASGRKDIFGSVNPLPAPGTDAAACLMPFSAAQPLPQVCPMPPPLPKGVPLTEIAGRLTVHRTLFGFGLYDIDMGGDTMVDLGSQEGYTASISKQDRSSTNRVELPTVACTIPLDQILYRGNLVAVLGQIGAATFLDNAALDTLLAGKYGASLAWFVMGAWAAGECAHTNITKSPSALKQVAASLTAQDTALRARRPMLLGDRGRVLVGGDNVSDMPADQAVAAISKVLGKPDAQTSQDSICDTHMAPGRSVTWKDLRVLVPTSPGVDRAGKIAGWELNWYLATPHSGLRTDTGIGIGDKLAAVKRAYPRGVLGPYDGSTRFDAPGTDLTFYFEETPIRVQSATSGFGCGT